MLINTTSIPLSIAVWLATDTYDHVSDPNYISATSLLKPIKSIVLERSIKIEGDTDIADLVPSKVGTAVHDQIEAAWKKNYRKAMKNLNYPDSVIDKIVINSDMTVAECHEQNLIPVYLEIRTTKQLGKWIIGGKFDFVIEGELTDFKTTKTYSYISGSNEPGYIKQGSIYKWLNPELITSPYLNIGYIFTDWIMMKSLQDKSYPNHNIIEKKLTLLSDPEIENFMRNVLNQVDKYTGQSQHNMPNCTKEELWQNDSVWKYFKDPAKRTRSTKNFDNPTDAHARNATDGNTGVVVEVGGEVKRCKYCNARSVCLQAENMEASGLLK